MSAKEEYFEFWGHVPGTPEAEEAWARKQAFDRGERLMPIPNFFVQRDICYDSPIDGRPITSRQARIEDLARNGCTEYDPGMRQDYDRRVIEAEAKTEKAMEATVEAEISRMPAVKRERLQAELDGGLVADVARLSSNTYTNVSLQD